MRSPFIGPTYWVQLSVVLHHEDKLLGNECRTIFIIRYLITSPKVLESSTTDAQPALPLPWPTLTRLVLIIIIYEQYLILPLPRPIYVKELCIILGTNQLETRRKKTRSQSLSIDEQAMRTGPNLSVQISNTVEDRVLSEQAESVHKAIIPT